LKKFTFDIYVIILKNNKEKTSFLPKNW